MLKRMLAMVMAFASLTLAMSVAGNEALAQTQRRGASRTTVRHGSSANNGTNKSTSVALAREIGHELAMLPFYDVFDWLDGRVLPDGTVQLRGQVVRPTTKTDAVRRVRATQGVTRVDDQIEVLPVSPNDDQLRIAIYRALFNFDSPLFTRYGTRAVPPIHIIVKNGRATLKGIVANQMDSQLAYTYARQVPGLFDVANELRVENERAR